MTRQRQEPEKRPCSVRQFDGRVGRGYLLPRTAPPDSFFLTHRESKPPPHASLAVKVPLQAPK